MNTVRVTISVTGTDDNGRARSFNGSGTIACIEATEGDILATSTRVKIADNGLSDFVSFIYLENNGSVDVAVGTEDSTVSRGLVVPPGASIFIPAGPRDQAASGAESVQIWTASGTAEVHYILFY